MKPPLNTSQNQLPYTPHNQHRIHRIISPYTQQNYNSVSGSPHVGPPKRSHLYFIFIMASDTWSSPMMSPALCVRFCNRLLRTPYLIRGTLDLGKLMQTWRINKCLVLEMRRESAWSMLMARTPANHVRLLVLVLDITVSFLRHR